VEGSRWCWIWIPIEVSHHFILIEEYYYHRLNKSLTCLTSSWIKEPSKYVPVNQGINQYFPFHTSQRPSKAKKSTCICISQFSQASNQSSPRLFAVRPHMHLSKLLPSQSAHCMFIRIPNRVCHSQRIQNVGSGSILRSVCRPTETPRVSPCINELID
jgi:hypothetical protein